MEADNKKHGIEIVIENHINGRHDQKEYDVGDQE